MVTCLKDTDYRLNLDKPKKTHQRQIRLSTYRGATGLDPNDKFLKTSLANPWRVKVYPTHTCKKGL